MVKGNFPSNCITQYYFYFIVVFCHFLGTEQKNQFSLLNYSKFVERSVKNSLLKYFLRTFEYLKFLTINQKI